MTDCITSAQIAHDFAEVIPVFTEQILFLFAVWAVVFFVLGVVHRSVIYALARVTVRCLRRLLPRKAA